MVRPLDFSIIPVHADADMFLEKRYAYNGSNLEYIGWTHVADASTARPIWFIIKLEYTGSDVTHQQLPNDGTNFTYVWDDRATYF